MPYLDVLRSDSAVAADLQLELVMQWLQTLERLEGLTESEYKTFMRYCTKLFLGEDDWLWRKDTKGAHKIVIPQESHCYDFRRLRQSSTVVVSKVQSQMSLEECKSWTCIVLLGLRVKVQVKGLSIKD